MDWSKMSGAGGFELYKNYMEFFFVVFIIIGAIIALLARSAVVSYIIIFLCGMFAGRVLYYRQDSIKLPFYVIIAGFAAGYLILVRYGSRLATAILFLAGAILCYKLFEKKILRDAPY
jgi:hypothetical protein